MLTYNFNIDSNLPLYEQLYSFIKNDILAKRLLPGERLPSKRDFAKNLGISTITVENAYLQLLAEGYITSKPRSGYYVDRVESTPIVPKEKYANATSVSSTDESTVATYLANFSSNMTPPSNFPFAIWTKLMRGVLSSNPDTLLMPSPGQGLLELRKAIANHLQAFRGLDVSPNQIIIGAGTEYLYGLLIQLLGRDKCYAVEDPGYQKIAQIYESNQVKCVHIELDNHGISIKDLTKSDSDILHLSPAHHFPTGTITSISRRHEILSWASQKSSRYIIEDEYDSEFRLTGMPIPPLASIDSMGKVIYMNTFSKSLSSTIRISYMVLPFSLMERFNKELSFYSCTVPNFEQYTLADFISKGYFEKHINRSRNYYRNVRDQLLNGIYSSSLEPLCSVSEENSGLHFLIKMKTRQSAKKYVDKLKSKRIKISLISDYYHNPENAKDDSLIINYSGINPESIPKIISIMEECIEN